jgi:N-acetylglucosaminyldiphosphoundecaprenol N-acetyl-beta-D-mannosaminyltransferase
MPDMGGGGHELGLARVDVLGVPVCAMSMAHAVAQVGRWVASRTPAYVCVTGVHGVMESSRDAALLAIHQRAGMVTADGMPLVWLARWAGYPQAERVYGPDLMLAVCEASVAAGIRHYFYGGGPGVADRLAGRLAARFPGLAVAGTYCPPFGAMTPAEEAAAMRHLRESRADIVWVGLSTPKQERWMAAHVGHATAPVLIGVGAAFDFHAGLKRQAPRWIQRSGGEWAFRLLTEPRRLARRYLVNNPAFLWKLAREWSPARARAAGARATVAG